MNTVRLGGLLRDTAEAPPETLRTAPERSVRVPSTPRNLAWGHVPTNVAPIVTLDPGDVAVVDTLSHQGLVNGTDPVTFLTGLGVDRSEVLADAEVAYSTVHRPEGADSHLLTGPIAVSGAVPGDAIRIDLLGAELRSSYGINVGQPGRGLLPDLLEQQSLRLLRLDASGTHVTFAPGISVPVAPFPGFLATTPPEPAGEVGTRIPGPWGGNLDLRILTAGSSLILPVHRAGALLWIGDPHAVQGHGEVNGTAVEQSARFEVRITRLPGGAPSSPVALTGEVLVATGIAVDTTMALQHALRNAIDLLLGWTRGRLSPADAYALCSIAGDLGLAEVVNGAAVAYLALPRDVITDGPS